MDITPPCMARSPLGFGFGDWKAILRSVAHDIEHDHVGIVAAGVAFFTMLAIFPFIMVCLSIFGLVADPLELQEQLQVLENLFPAEAWAILNSQIMSVASAPVSELGLRIVIGVFIAFWSAGAGIRAMMRAMNIAYGEKETRGLVRFYTLASVLTLSVTLFMWVALGVIIGVPSVLNFFSLEGVAAFSARYLPWLLVIGLFSIATIILYKIGPSRRPAKFVWIIPGVIFSTLGWLFISSVFSRFVAEFGTYNKTYGSLAAVILLLVWFWLTAFVIVAGAVLNAAMETHTQVDTTIGPDRPAGERGASVADNVNIAI